MTEGCAIPPDIRLKYAFRREIRMFTIKSSTPFEQVVAQLRQNTLQMLPAEEVAGAARLILRYVEDDLVTIYDERDWKECLVYYAEELHPKGQKLKLFLEFEAEGAGGGEVQDHLPPGWGTQHTVLVTNQDRPRSKSHHIQSHCEGQFGSGDFAAAEEDIISVSTGTPCQLSLSRSGSGLRRGRRNQNPTPNKPITTGTSCLQQQQQPPTPGDSRAGTAATLARPETSNMSTSTTSLAVEPVASTSTMDTQTSLQTAVSKRPQSSATSSQTDGPLLSATPEPEKTARITGWVRGNLIGRGASSEVYFGMNQHAANFFAVKQTMIDRRDPEHAAKIKALQKEIEMMSKHHHENIVRYLGSELKGNMFSIFLEFVPGGSIASLLSRFGSFHEKVVRLYTRQILQGLHFLHTNHVIHRDIKGANILVSDKGMVKLADFGCSKRLTVDSTGTKTVLGTALWMAPEVIRRSKYGAASDIWSVGCTVIEMATGKPPWMMDRKFDTEIQAMYFIAQSGCAPRFPSHLSKNAKEFLRSTLHVEPEKRFFAGQLLQRPFITEECVDINDISKSPCMSLADLSVKSNVTDETLMSTMQTMSDTIDPPTTIASITKFSIHASTFDPGSVASELPRGDFDVSRDASPEPSITAHRRASGAGKPPQLRMSDASGSAAGGAPTPVRRNVDDSLGDLSTLEIPSEARLRASVASRRWSSASGDPCSASASPSQRHPLPLPSDHSPRTQHTPRGIAPGVPGGVLREPKWPASLSRENSLTARKDTSAASSLRGSLKWSNVTRPPEGAVEMAGGGAARPQTSPSRTRVGAEAAEEEALAKTQTAFLEDVRESLAEEKQPAAGAANANSFVRDHTVLLDYLQTQTRRVFDGREGRAPSGTQTHRAGQAQEKQPGPSGARHPLTPDAVPGAAAHAQAQITVPRDVFPMHCGDRPRYAEDDGDADAPRKDSADAEILNLSDAPPPPHVAPTPDTQPILAPRPDELLCLAASAGPRPSPMTDAALTSDCLSTLNRTAVHLDVSPKKAPPPQPTPPDAGLGAGAAAVETQLEKIQRQIVEYEGVGRDEEGEDTPPAPPTAPAPDRKEAKAAKRGTQRRSPSREKRAKRDLSSTAGSELAPKERALKDQLEGGRATSPKKRTHSRKRAGRGAPSALSSSTAGPNRTKCRASVPIMPKGGGEGAPAAKYETDTTGRRGSGGHAPPPASASGGRLGRSRPRDMEYTDLEVDPQLLASQTTRP